MNKYLSFLLFFLSLSFIFFEKTLWFFASGFSICFCLKIIKDNKNRLFLAWGWFFCVQLIQLYWMTAIKYTSYWMLFVYIFIAALLALQFVIFCYFFFLCEKKLLFYEILALCGLWVLLEYSRLYLFSGFPWNSLGVILSYNKYSIQLASLFGVYGLSFFVILINLVSYKFLFLKKNKRNAIVFFSIIIAPYLVGFFSLKVIKNKHRKEKNQYLSVAIINTNYTPYEKLFYEHKRNEFIHPYVQWNELFCSLSKKNIKIDLMVMPEIAFPGGAFNPIYEDVIIDIFKNNLTKEFALSQFKYPYISNNNKFLTNAALTKMLADYFLCDLIIGLEDVYNKTAYNSAFYFNNYDINYQKYDKKILIPLVEYFPFSFCKKFAKQYGIESSFKCGEKEGVFKAKNNNYGVVICCEELYPSIFRELKKNNADIIVSLSNDAWFDNSSLPLKHLYNARIRCVESGIFLIRSCNGGISTVIDPFGKELKKKYLQKDKKINILYANIPKYKIETLYGKLGDGFILSFSFFFFIILIFIKYNGIFRKN